MKKNSLKGVILFIIFMTFLPAKVYIISSQNVGNDKNYFVEKICIDGYVYINIYQKKPVMTISLGSSTAYPKYPVLQGITQSFIKDGKPETCINY